MMSLHRMPEAVPGRALPLALSVFLAAGIALAVLFMTLPPGMGPTALDLRAQAWFLGHRTPVLTVAAVAVTDLGSSPLLLAATAGVFILLRRRGHGHTALIAAITVAGGGGANELVKLVARRPRPDRAGFLINATGFSLPSGHAALGTCFYGMLAILAFCALRPGWLRALAAGASLLLLLAIGASRVYLGVHWATDVLFGFAGGLFWLSGALLAAGWRHRGPSIEGSPPVDTEPRRPVSPETGRPSGE